MYRHYLATPLRRAFNVAFRQQVRFFDDEFSYMPSTLNMLNKEEDAGIMVEAYSPYGFKLNNNIRIFGPCALFPRSILHWNVQGPEDITEDSLSLFCLLDPKPDILLLGVGSDTSKFDKKLIRYLRSKNIGFEVLTTDHACSTFNFLNAERRFVVAGLIPPNFEFDENQGFAVKAEGISNSSFMFQSGIFEAPKDSEETKKITKEMLGEDNEKLWDIFRKKYLKNNDINREESDKHDEKEYLKTDPLNQDKSENEKK